VVRPGVPKAVCGVVLGMLEKKPRNRPGLREVLAALNRVDPAAWDEVLPTARTIEVTGPATAADTSAASTKAGNGTATTGTETGDAQLGAGTEFETDPDTSPAMVATTPRGRLVHGPSVSLTQPVFVPRRQRRMLKRLLIVAASILVGLTIGLVVLMLL
jgi:hypothetical protein